MSGCIFCKIASKVVNADIVYEDQHLVVFKDLKPAAPVHLLLIPKKHYSSLQDLEEGDFAIAGRINAAAVRVARDMGFAENGFRLVCNCGWDGGQVVNHLHYHLLAGRELQWPPG
ncbi:MAG: HIT-like protein [Firmicutes bacterium ADurb.Bin373]|nr:histidine triad nucleotide-binding protein [Bacillota bacterium]OQA11372.1 MAG: HIT-like protein [Firmicutes bacterium ADurb.Bin373]